MWRNPTGFSFLKCISRVKPTRPDFAAKRNRKVLKNVKLSFDQFRFLWDGFISEFCSVAV